MGLATKSRPLIMWQSHHGDISGANNALLDYIKSLNQYYNFHVIIPFRGSMIAFLKKNCIPFSVVKQYPWSLTLSSRWEKYRVLLRNRICFHQTKLLLRKFTPYMVFTNTQTMYVSAEAAKRLNIKHVWFIHEFGKEDFGFTIGFGNERYGYQQIQRWADLVVVNSEAVLKKFIPILSNSSIIKIYQPVSWNDSKFSEDRVNDFLMFGQISRSKGHQIVIESFAQLVEKHLNKSLHIIGPSDDQEYINTLHHFIKTHGLDKYISIQVGYFDKHQVIPRYKALIMASDSEAFGRVIIEAQKAGLHVIAKNTGAINELIQTPEDSLFVNVDQLVSLLCNFDYTKRKVNNLNYNEQLEIQKLVAMLSTL